MAVFTKPAASGFSAQEEIFTLDLGTTKFCLGCLAVPTDPASFQPRFDFLLAPSAGFRKGMLVNFQEAKAKLQALMRNAEAKFGRAIDQVVLGIAGNHISSRVVSSGLALKGRIVSREVLQALQSAARRQTSENKEIIHAVPIHYQIDDRPAGDTPLGLSGQGIKASYLIIEADSFYVRDIVHLCNESGVEVQKLYCEAYASSSVTVNDDQKQHGCAVIDIGGGSSDGIIYHLGRPKGVFTLNIGGQHMTNDLSIGLNLPWSEAEQVKTFFGLKSATASGGDDGRFTVRNIHGEVRQISFSHVYPILRPRIEELAMQVKRVLQPVLPALKSGIMLTGGGSRLEGIEGAFRQAIGIDTRIFTPRFPSPSAGGPGPSADELSGAYATSLGMLWLEFEDAAKSAPPPQASTASRYWHRLVRLMKELS